MGSLFFLLRWWKFWWKRWWQRGEKMDLLPTARLIRWMVWSLLFIDSHIWRHWLGSKYGIVWIIWSGSSTFRRLFSIHIVNARWTTSNCQRFISATYSHEDHTREEEITNKSYKEQKIHVPTNSSQTSNDFCHQVTEPKMLPPPIFE